LMVYLTVFGGGADEGIAAASAEDGIRSTKLSQSASRKPIYSFRAYIRVIRVSEVYRSE
jgi:hypothetical protein